MHPAGDTGGITGEYHICAYISKHAAVYFNISITVISKFPLDGQ